MNNKIIGSIALAGLSLFALPATAGVVTQYTGFDNFNGTCPSATQANLDAYMEDWGDAIAFRLKKPVSEVDADDACLFNRNLQALLYNEDGTPRNANSGAPDGVPYTPDQVGTVVISTTRGTTSTVAGDLNGDAYGSMLLDANNLGLPEIKVLADAALGQRLTVNGFAATEYLWTGDDGTRLEYDINFDFFASDNQLCIDQGPCIYDSAFTLWAGVSTDMVFDAQFAIGNVSSPGNVITRDAFQFGKTDLGRPSGLIEGVLSLAFDVNNGDQFFLWAGVQALALDGGFLNAANTVTTDLRLEGLTSEASREIFAEALRPAPPTPVNAPATLPLLLGGSMLLLLRRRQRNAL